MTLMAYGWLVVMVVLFLTLIVTDVMFGMTRMVLMAMLV
jgi:hypothetical protein